MVIAQAVHEISW